MDYKKIIKTESVNSSKIWGEAYSYLPKIINFRDLKIGAEVGVAYGGHADKILSSTNVSKLYGIDPFQHFPNYNDPMNFPQKKFDELYKFTLSRLSKYGRRYFHIRKTSEKASKEIKKLLAFIYIDADHSPEGVLKDLSLWFSKVKDGGVIAGHDYGHENFPGIKKVIDEFFGRFKWKVNIEGGGFWWVEKKPIYISYIIPAYNCELTIPESVESIMDGNFTLGDELIIVNDGSTDETQQILTNLQKQFPVIKIITHKKNKGGGNARNTAVKNASNEIIFCLDSDNILVKGSIKKLKAFMINNVCDVASFQKLHYFKDSINKITHKWIFKERIIKLKDVLANKKLPGSSGNYMYTKTSWRKAGGYPEFAGALDTWGFGFRQLASGSKMMVMPNSYYYHRYGYNSYWVRDSENKDFSLKALEIFKPYFELFNRRDVEYITSNEGKFKWFEQLEKRPMHLKDDTKKSIIKKLIIKIKNILKHKAFN